MGALIYNVKYRVSDHAEKDPGALEPMDTSLVIGLVVLLVVGFFAYQWWAKTGRRLTGNTRKQPMLRPQPQQQPQQPQQQPQGQQQPQQEQPSYPSVAGQTEAEMRAPEPLQRRAVAPQQQPVGHEAHSPAQIQDNLRHPEQMFHQPQGDQAVPTMQISDITSGRAATQSTPLSGNQQPFSPEMAQNGGPMVGNSVFAYDGMEPSGFASF